MTLSKTFKALLTRIRRTITRTFRATHLKSTKLTISFPPFIKLEIATETDPLQAGPPPAQAGPQARLTGGRPGRRCGGLGIAVADALSPSARTTPCTRPTRSCRIAARTGARCESNTIPCRRPPRISAVLWSPRGLGRYVQPFRSEPAAASPERAAAAPFLAPCPAARPRPRRRPAARSLPCRQPRVRSGAPCRRARPHSWPRRPRRRLTAASGSPSSSSTAIAFSSGSTTGRLGW